MLITITMITMKILINSMIAHHVIIIQNARGCVSLRMKFRVLYFLCDMF